MMNEDNDIPQNHKEFEDNDIDQNHKVFEKDMENKYGNTTEDKMVFHQTNTKTQTKNTKI